MVRLGDLAIVQAGGTPARNKKEYWLDGEIPWVKISDFREGSVLVTEEKITQLGIEKSSAKIFKKGTILFTIFATLGEVAILKIDATTNQAIAGIDIINLRIEKKYLFIYLKSIKSNIKKLGRGVAQNNINLSILKEILIPLPPLDIQKKIAAALDTANALIEKRKEQIEKLDLLIKSQFIEMFGDPVTNPKGWEKKKLKKECDVITGNTPSRLNLSNYGNYIEWIKSDNINTTSMYLTQAREGLSEEGLSIARSVDEGNILMTCIAGSLSCIGNVAIADRKVSFNQQINAIVPKENNHLFIYHLLLLSKPYIQGKVNMSLKGILSKGKLLELEFFFPPLSLQIQFAEFVEKVEAQKTLLQKSLADMEQNYQSLLQKCFKGEIF